VHVELTLDVDDAIVIVLARMAIAWICVRLVQAALFATR
jgi:hypothetical protein